jgi:hypothetical protein
LQNKEQTKEAQMRFLKVITSKDLTWGLTNTLKVENNAQKWKF